MTLKNHEKYLVKAITKFWLNIETFIGDYYCYFYFSITIFLNISLRRNKTFVAILFLKEFYRLRLQFKHKTFFFFVIFENW